MQFSWATIYTELEMYFVDAEASYAYFWLAVTGIVLYGGFLFVLILANIGLRLMLTKKLKEMPLSQGSLPGVSVIKPLLNVDPLLEENLESHFKMEYPKFELLFCVADEQDPAVSIVKHLQKKYPKVESRLFTGATPGVLNPVISNMTPGYNNASYDYIWMSTSRIKASSDIIKDMATKLQQPNVALVHQLPFISNSNGFAQSVEKIHFGCLMARYYIFINMCGENCVNDMSCMYKKPLLDKLNGFSWYGRYLAEDFFIPDAFMNKGYKTALSSYPANQNVSISSLKSWKDRMVRWRRLRLNMLALIYTVVLEPLSGALTIGLYFSWSFYYLFNINPYYIISFHLIFVCIVDYYQLQYIQDGPLGFSVLRYILCWIVVEVGLIWIFIESHIAPKTITWGNKTFYMGKSGVIDHVNIRDNTSS